MSFEIREVEEVYEVRGESIKVTAPARFDVETNQQVFDEGLDNSAITRAFDIYRKNNQVITIARIKQLRSKLGLSQRDFAALLGWSPTTVATYETGALPSNANNTRLLALEENPTSALNLLEHAKDSLTQRGKDALCDHLKASVSDDVQHFFVSGINLLFKEQNYTEYSGYVSFDLKKFTNMVLFFVNRIPRLSMTKLNKLMFYADFKYFGLHTISMSGVPYARLDYGPVPDNYKLLYGAIEEAGMIRTEEMGNETMTWEYYVPENQTLVDSFTPKELRVLNDTLQRFSKFSANQISKKSHSERGWLENKTGQKISYEFAEDLSTLSD